MNKYIINKISENKWFGLYDKVKELSTEEFIENICEKCKLYILMQYAESNSLGLYAVIKCCGLYGFTTEKTNFFQNTDIQLGKYRGIQVFLINETQKFGDFIKILDDFLVRQNKKIKKEIEFVYYQDEIDKLIE